MHKHAFQGFIYLDSPVKILKNNKNKKDLI